MSLDPTHSHVLLEWDYTPAAFFDEPISLVRDDCVLSIGNGKIQARVNPELAKDRGLRERVKVEIEGRFLAAQVLRHEAYVIAEPPTVVKVRHDGLKDFEVEFRSGAIVISTFAPTIRVAAADGTVIYDSKQQERDESHRLQQRVVQHHGDSVLIRLLASYRAAVHDPDNELVHLYELRDALATHFGGDHKARKALGITDKDWSNFGRLCNVEPLSQGRHRGSAVAGLRDATNGELEACRAFARSLLNAYLDVLEGTPRP